MPIRLITGLPGHGKTLQAVRELRDAVKSDPERLVFSNINGLRWDRLGVEDEGEQERRTKFNALKWYELPEGSLIIIDEAQNFFRPRAAGSTVPPHQTELEIHRHRGFDIWLITQSPALIDAHVRKLVDQHVHVHRVFGTKHQKIRRWNGCNMNCAIQLDETNVDEERQSLDKSVFEFYKSAEIHTVKARLPWKKLRNLAALVVAIPALIGGSLWLLMRNAEGVGAWADEGVGESVQVEADRVARSIEIRPSIYAGYLNVRDPQSRTFTKVYAVFCDASGRLSLVMDTRTVTLRRCTGAELEQFGT